MSPGPTVSSVSSLTAIVLCGGLGTRLAERLPDTPKFLAPIGGRPLADWLFTLLASEGILDVVLCTGFLGDRVQAFCGNGTSWGLRVRYSDDPVPLGTAGAIRQALHRLPTSDPILVVNGDTLVPFRLQEALALHISHNARATMLVARHQNSAPYGSVTLGSGGEVLGFVEKGHGGPGHVNAGVYVLATSTLTGLPVGVRSSLERDILPTLVGFGLIAAVAPGTFIDIGTPSEYDRAQALSLPEFQSSRKPGQ